MKKQEQYQSLGYLSEDFRLFHLNDIQREKIDYHYHEFYKIIFLLSGTGGYSIEGKRYLLKAGDIVLVERQAVHRPEFENGLPYERVILYISPEFLERESTVDCDLASCFSGEEGHVLRPAGEEREKLEKLLSLLETEASSDRFGRLVASNGILLRLLVDLFRSFRHQECHNPAPIRPQNKRIHKITEYLDNHLTENISIDDLAEKFYLSRYYLMHKFKEETGMTIYNYLTERRLFLAHTYLTQGYPVTEACFMSGFQNYASFSRAYGKLFGTTPTGRKKNKVIAEEAF